MFESSQFLSFYLPNYFEFILSRQLTSHHVHRTHFSFLKIVAQLIDFSHDLYINLNLQNQFYQFLSTQFLPQNPSPTPSLSPSCKITDTQPKRIRQIIESKVDKISLTCINTYIKMIEINQLIHGEKLSEEKILSYSKQIVQLFNKIRFQYEIYQYQMCIHEEYDTYISAIFQMVFQTDINHGMRRIIQSVICNECSNISDKLVKDIEHQINKNNNLFDCSEKEQKTIDVKRIFRKVSDHKKIKLQQKQQFEAKNVSSLNQKHYEKLSPVNKKKVISHKHSLQTEQKIKAIYQLKKQKPISKKRTLYYERKMIHIPKIKDELNKIHYLVSTTTIPSIDNSNKNQDNFEDSSHTYCFEDNQSCLVQSTPKKRKIEKMWKKNVITHKLNFL